MATHQSRAGTGRTSTGGGDGFLRVALKLDAAASGALGVLTLLAAGIVIGVQRPFALLLGTPLTLLVPAGLFLVAFALFVWLAGTRRRIAGTAAWAIVAVNALWVLGSVALVVAGWFPLTPLGVVFVVVQAAAVVLFACLQLIGLRRARPATG